MDDEKIGTCVVCHEKHPRDDMHYGNVCSDCYEEDVGEHRAEVRGDDKLLEETENAH